MEALAARDFITLPKFPVETPLGPAVVLCYNGSVRLSSMCDDRKGSVIINGVPYRVDITLDWTPDGWEFRPGGWPLLSRADVFGVNNASSAAERKAKEVLIPWLMQWADEHPEERKQGILADINNDLWRLQKDIDSKESELHSLKLKREELLSTESHITGWPIR